MFFQEPASQLRRIFVLKHSNGIKGIAKLAKLLPKFTKWIDDVLARNGRGALKAEEALLKNSFKFKNFTKLFDDHILRGEIKIKIIHNQNPKNVKEVYTYATGKGGKNADEILPPWQVKKELKGVHTYANIDNKILRIRKIKEIKTLHSGEKVEIVEIDFFVKELNKWSKKANSSTLWPKEWSLDKIKRVTKEASENVNWNRGNKYIGTSKEGYQVEFFSEANGVINNSYLNFEILK